MKLFAAPALCLCLLLTACAESATGPGPEITDAKNKVEANVEGMTCTVVCAGEVCDAAKGIDGVTAAHADVETGQVTLALEDDADKEAVIAEFKKAIPALAGGEKYTVGEVASSDAKACAEGCTKDCCAAKDKAAGDGATSCPEGCTKDCCKEA